MALYSPLLPGHIFSNLATIPVDSKSLKSQKLCGDVLDLSKEKLCGDVLDVSKEKLCGDVLDVSKEKLCGNALNYCRVMAIALSLPHWGPVLPHPYFFTAAITIAAGSFMCCRRIVAPALHVPLPDHLPQAHCTIPSSSLSLVTIFPPHPHTPTPSSPWLSLSLHGNCSR